MSQQQNFSSMLLIGGLSGSVAELATLPLDTIKVRMQISQQKYSSIFGSMVRIFREEGIGAFYQGALPGVLRQLSFGSFRLGIFDFSMQRLRGKKGEQNITLLDRIGLGIFSGALAICIANPVDMLKVRFQNQNRALDKTAPRLSLIETAKSIYQKEGLWAFYQSLAPNIFRNSIINAAELATYSQFKSFFLSTGLFKNENFGLYFVCSFLAGWMAVSIGSPFDVIKSRMMVGKMVNGQNVLYSGIPEAVSHLFQEKGIKGFYGGYLINCSRLISWNVAMFLTKEKLTSIYFNRK